MTDTTHPTGQEQDRNTLRRARELLAFGTNELFPPEELDSRETWWRDHYEQLKARGYVLRPRYTPNWVPSWKNAENKSWADCEDGKRMTYAQIMDATRLSDGKYVTLKRVCKLVHPHEVDIGLYFSSGILASHSANHCVPIYEVITLQDDANIIILVMPLLRAYADPYFDTFGEAIDCFHQLFEVFSNHARKTINRDCMNRNIALDPSELYPNSFHPMKTMFKRDYSGFAKHFTRTQRPPKYYFIDFGLSRKYDPSEANAREIPIRGGDTEVPEFQNSNEPCNPFPTDVFCLGNAIKKGFIQTKRGFEFMEPLVRDMIQADRTKRPNMEEVVVRFDKIRQSLSGWKLRSRVVDDEEDTFERVTRTVSYWIRRVTFVARGVPPIPTRS
ncbi:hypothetical protein J3R83DRAFT_3809 [Lanmaoa asiatica]|nr:hypothetical protein J3R83DRAFT_3809 [Lanmaoa asiatica]